MDSNQDSLQTTATDLLVNIRKKTKD
jgi:hypothetical protein